MIWGSVETLKQLLLLTRLSKVKHEVQLLPRNCAMLHIIYKCQYAQNPQISLHKCTYLLYVLSIKHSPYLLF